jgi:hypothetical protein
MPNLNHTFAVDNGHNLKCALYTLSFTRVLRRGSGSDECRYCVAIVRNVDGVGILKFKISLVDCIYL